MAYTKTYKLSKVFSPNIVRNKAKRAEQNESMSARLKV